MKLLSAFYLTLQSETINAAPLHNVKDYTFQLAEPQTEYSVKVASHFFIAMCQDRDWGEPCIGADVAPGLCYQTPRFGVTAIQPSQDMLGCTLYKGRQCDVDKDHLDDVAFPGIPDLTVGGFNDQVNSFICY